MKAGIIKRVYLLIVALSALCISDLYAQDSGGRASYTRGGWVGARYVAIGKAAEVIADDVYAIYWNPAGLCELKNRERISPDKIREKAQRSDISNITEQDLIKFSDEESSRSFVQIGASAGLLDIERQTGFTGVAFKLFKGVAGIGVNAIQSSGIDARDSEGAFVKHLSYGGYTCYFSYGWSTGITNIGASLKCLIEKIGDKNYFGGGIDFGTTADILPFLKLGFVIQDIGTSLYNNNESGAFQKRFDFGYPSIKVGALITTTTDIVIALSVVKKVEQKDFEVNAGIQYNVFKRINLYLGLNDSNFSAGMSVRMWDVDIGYAFAFDKINYGINNLVSISLVL